jgi:hypothetical protein
MVFSERRRAMEELARRFRRAAEKRTGLRYDGALRELALQYAAAASGRGKGGREIAADLGLNAVTLARWQEEVRPESSSALREVVVVESGGGPVLVMPSGLRVEGLSISELISVLAGLG